MRRRPSLSPDAFPGTDRFQVIRKIGSGGMGVVYEALDRERNVHVALKTLRESGGENVLRLKHEFRTLQDVQHPNLVALGELIEEGGVWFFTMELIRGVSFLKYVRPGWDDTTDVSPSRDTMDAFLGVESGGVRQAVSTIFDEKRLRHGLAQLARGLLALHGAGKIHRDVKPSNVLVTQDERVVILDFGLVTSVDPGGIEIDSSIVGTALYMAPEQALGGRVGPEADWYSAGVVLYEAMVGAPPFLGPNLQVLMDKQKLAPPTPKSRAAGIPDDLDELAMEMLRFDPAARPSGRSIQRRVGALMVELDDPAPSTRTTQTGSFVGRERELEVLATALADVRARKQVTVYLSGESGIGKSALVRAFTKRVAEDERVVVLAGRCYEREAVPYKALDGVIDELASYVQRLSKVEAAALTPQWADLLLQAFPVLSRIEVFAQTPRHTVRDAQEQRTRLFAALRELLTRLCDRRTVILTIDDLQWADADSLALLSELLRPPDAPSMLLLASWREAGEDPSGIRQRLESLPGEIRHLAIEKLSKEATTELARLLLVRGGVTGARAEEIAREADGHPLFVDELIRFAAMHGRDETFPRFSLEEALGNRIARLDPGPMRVLELLTLAGAPLEQETCAHAAGIAVGAFAQTAAQLRTANLARTSGARKLDRIEPYHDRVRDAVLTQLDAGRRKSLHGDLARALEASGRADPEALAVHHHAAGDDDRAATYATEAAGAATRTFAFDRAARLYQMALDLMPAGPGVRALQVALGAALAKAGRGAEAGTALLAATRGAPVAEALDLRARAIQALLYAGRFDDGIAELRGVLASQGVRYPKSARRALLSVIGNRVMLAARGLRFKERDESQVSQEMLARIDLLYYAASNLAPIDNIRGHAFQVRGARLALEAGERYRVARALVAEAGYRGIPGRKAVLKCDAILDIAEELGQRVDNPHLKSQLVAGRGTAAFLKGEYTVALDRCDAAQALSRQHGVAEYADMNLMYQWIAESLLWLGKLSDLATYVDRSIRDGEERGNLYLSTTLRTSVLPFVRLAEDDAAAARFEVDDALERWSPQRFHVQHFYALKSHANADLYQGEGARAVERLRREWGEMRSSLILTVSFVRTYMWDTRARAALAAAASAAPSEQRALLASAEKDAKRILGEKSPWSTPLGVLIRAGVAARRGDQDGARALFEQAVAGLDTAELGLYAAAARRRLGTMIGGDRGAELVAAADAWMSTQKVKSPARMTTMLAPG